MKYLLLLFLSLPLFLSAQAPTKPSDEPKYIEDKVGTFRAGLIFGINGSQMDGDGFAGFDRVGFNAGGKVLIIVHEKWQPGFELLYSQKGSEVRSEFLNLQYKYVLDYVQIPLLMHYVDRRIMFEAGPSYNRLVRSKAEIAGIEYDSPAGFRKSDITLVGGMTFYLNPNKNIAVNGRGEISVIDIFDGNLAHPTNPTTFSRQVFRILSARLYYIF